MNVQSFFSIVLAVCSISISVRASDTATCRLVENVYSSSELGDFQFIETKRISEISSQHFDLPEFKIAEKKAAISFEATFSMFKGIRGNLNLNSNLPGFYQEMSSSYSENNLEIRLDDIFIGGKSQYVLNCRFD